ncbi:MAG: hypothetical protein V4773_06985 [Verrucomicrobiota bacterium]
MKSLRSVLTVLAVCCGLQSANAQFLASMVQTEGGNHSNVTCYVNVSTTQYVSTSSTPVSSNPTLPGTINAGLNAEWTVSNSIAGSSTQWTWGSNFTACAHLADIKGKNHNGGSVPLSFYSAVAVTVTGNIRVSTSGTAIGGWEIYKNASLYASGSGFISNYSVSVSNGDTVHIKVNPATDNTTGPALAVWNY